MASQAATGHAYHKRFQLTLQDDNSDPDLSLSNPSSPPLTSSSTLPQLPPLSLANLSQMEATNKAAASNFNQSTLPSTMSVAQVESGFHNSQGVSQHTSSSPSPGQHFSSAQAYSQEAAPKPPAPPLKHSSLSFPSFDGPSVENGLDSLRMDGLSLSASGEGVSARHGPGAALYSDPSRTGRPSSFFGLERPVAAINAAAAAAAQQQQVPIPGQDIHPIEQNGTSSPSSLAEPDNRSKATPALPQGKSSLGQGTRPSSFYGIDANLAASATQDGLGAASLSPDPAIDAPHSDPRASAYLNSESSYRASSSTTAGGNGNGNAPLPPPPLALSHSVSYGGLGSSAATRPSSIAPSLSSGPLLNQSHLKPGQKASLLSTEKTLELYRQNAKKTNDANLIYELAVFMIDASKTMGGDESSPKDEAAKEELVKEATGLLKKIADRGHPDAQYFLADCYANGMGTNKGKQDFGSAYTYFVLAAKHGHPDAAYRAGTCYEKGWGCRKDSSKALQFYRKAASQNHPGAMYRLATAELNGELGLKKNAKEGVKWLKRSAEAATPEFPHALHELALLHERGIDNILFVDPEYSCELLAQAGEIGYAPSAYKLGVNYEYGRMGCPQDGGLSIHMYNIAAQQNHKEACFALTAWYLVGAPGILPQSDTEAFLWAKKAAEQGLAKAEYAVGYFTEMGIGTIKDLTESKAWYQSAAQHGDKRAQQRLAAFAARPDNRLAGIGTRAPPPHSINELGKRGQPTSAPISGSVSRNSMAPAMQINYTAPMSAREAQAVQRGPQFFGNPAVTERVQQAREILRSPPLDGEGFSPRMTSDRSLPTQPFSQSAYPSYPASASGAMQKSMTSPPGPMSMAPDNRFKPLPQPGPSAADESSKKKKKWFART